MADICEMEREPVVQARLKQLYPAVVYEQTRLPMCWSERDKHNFIGLDNNHLQVQYKGQGKTPKDAASVRANHPIPSACGIYYFEVKIISKGRDGYMGIGLSAHDVSTNRLPGWDKKSYGYHGDDGNSFCCSGQGQSYGPTFTTGDVIGCCVNMIDNTCFFTKNGVNLGTAFKDIPHGLYPTVGLQTPGETIEANFGQHSFVFDIEDYMQEYKIHVSKKVENAFTDDHSGHWQSVLQKIVSSYLVHYGYCSTAESFARVTEQSLQEELASIRNRQRIQKLVLGGRIGEAITATQELYPGLLDSQQDLYFMLKCRQFVEMVDSTQSECHGPRSPRQLSNRSSPCHSPLHHSARSVHSSRSSSPYRLAGSPSSSIHSNSNSTATQSADVQTINGCSSNGSAHLELNGNNNSHTVADDEMEVDPPAKVRPALNEVMLMKILQFGRELKMMCSSLEQTNGPRATNTKLLEEVFSLLAYADPWNSPVGGQLHHVRREPVCAALNCAILDYNNMAQQPALETIIGQTEQTLNAMSRSSIGSCAFARLSDFIKLDSSSN